MTAASRTTWSRLARLDAALTTRDRAVLGSLAARRLATTNQIERLHFTASTPLADARACRRTLARLQGEGLITPLARRIGGVRSGSAGYVWSLGTAGQRLVTGRGPSRGAVIRRPWTPSLPFVSHRLAITELAVRLVEAERQGALELVNYVSEPDCWRRYTAPQGGLAHLRPDASAVMGDGQFEDAWFIEVDLGTESPQVLIRKRAAYLAYYRSGREQQATGVFPWVIYLVPDERRRRTVERALGRPRDGEPDLFVVARFDEAVAVLAGGRS
jgi:hypothetical protein